MTKTKRPPKSDKPIYKAIRVRPDCHAMARELAALRRQDMSVVIEILLARELASARAEVAGNGR